MDSLPVEAVVNIFSYLPPNDVIHSRLLSKRYETIIRNFRNQLKLHEISLEVHASVQLTRDEEALSDEDPIQPRDFSTRDHSLTITTARGRFYLTVTENEVESDVEEYGPFQDAFEKSLLIGQSPQFSHFLTRLLSFVKVKLIYAKSQWDNKLLEILSETIGASPFPVAEEYRIQLDLFWFPRHQDLLPFIYDTWKVLLEPRDLSDPRVFLVASYYNLKLYIINIKSLWKKKELKNTSIRLIYLEDCYAYEIMPIINYDDVDLIGATKDRLYWANIDAYPEELTMVDQRDGSTLTLNFKKVGEQSIFTYTCDYNN